MSNESGTFHGDGPSIFSQKAGLKNRQLFGFLDWKIPGTHGACAKSKVVKLEREFRSCISLAQRKILIAHTHTHTKKKKSSKSNNSGIHWLNFSP
jgi:hypothetical protein